MKQGSDEWHKARENRYTGSRMAAYIGVDPYCSRAKAYREFMGMEPPFEGNEATAYGTEHEPIAIHAYESETGCLVAPASFYVHPEYDLIGASPDGFVDEGIIEVKCKFNQTVWETVPAQYMAQIQCQLEVTDKAWCDFVSWSPDDMAIFRVPRSTEYWESALVLLFRFIDCVNTMTPPARQKKPVMPDVNFERTM